MAEQHKTQEALNTANSALKLSKTMRNFNDAPVSPIAGASGGATVGGGVAEAAGVGAAAAGAGEAAGAAAGLGSLAELAPLALL